MEALTRLPFTTQKQIFLKLADVADIEKMEEPLRSRYEESLKEYRDYLSVQKAAKNEGRAEGRAEGLAEGRAEGRVEGLAEGMEKGEEIGIVKGQLKMARKLKENGVDIEIIMRSSGLSKEEIEGL